MHSGKKIWIFIPLLILSYAIFFTISAEEVNAAIKCSTTCAELGYDGSLCASYEPMDACFPSDEYALREYSTSPGGLCWFGQRCYCYNDVSCSKPSGFYCQDSILYESSDYKCIDGIPYDTCDWDWQSGINCVSQPAVCSGSKSCKKTCSGTAGQASCVIDINNCVENQNCCTLSGGNWDGSKCVSAPTTCTEDKVEGSCATTGCYEGKWTTPCVNGKYGSPYCKVSGGYKCTAGQTCQNGICTGGPVTCNNNNKIDLAGEQCDGTDLGGKSCSDVDPKFTGGPLKCSPQCTWDTSGCTSGCDPNNKPTTCGMCGTPTVECKDNKWNIVECLRQGKCNKDDPNTVNCISETSYQSCNQDCSWGSQKQVPENQICQNNRLINIIPRLTPEGASGYCYSSNQCLLKTPNECKSYQTFDKDNYCGQNGEWTTRTKFIALQLTDLVGSGDYVIFCDSYEKTLNFAGYAVAGSTAEALIKTNANNFCVLEYNNQVIFGTSLNKKLSEDASFLKIINIASCSVSGTGDQYYACDSTSKSWYNPVKQSIIYSKQAINLDSNLDSNFLKRIFDIIRNAISMEITQKPVSNSFVDNIAKFGKLYLNRKGTIEISGAIENKGAIKNLLIEYKGFSTNICSFIKTYSKQNKDTISGLSGIECSQQGTTYHILAQGQTSTAVSPEQILDDLTAKLRFD